MGGPIVKNKLFFFASGEFFKKSYPNVYSPDLGAYEQEKGKEKDSQILKKAVTIDGKEYTHFTPEVAQAVIDHYKATYAPGIEESYGPHQKADQSINALARIDWNINDANKLMLRYQFAHAFSDCYASGFTSYYFNNSSYKMVDYTNTIVAELNSRISDNVQNMFRASAVFVRDHRDVAYKAANMYINDNVYYNIGTEYSSGANSMDSNAFTITDNVSWYVGNHELTFGTHNEIYSFNNLFLQAAYGEYVFKNLQDFFSNTANQFQYRYADPEVTGSDDPLWKATTYAAQFGLYAQDEWKPNRNFALTYGLRVDVPVLLNKPTTNPEYNANAIAVNNQEIVGVVPKATPLWSPRVGFRWFLNESHNTLLRGGAGLFTGRVPFVWISNAYNNTGMEAKSVTMDNPGWMDNADVLKSNNPYQSIVKPGLASAGGKATINTLNENFKYPQVFRVNLGFEQVFLKNWKFTFDGVYSKTLNNVFFKNLALSSDNVVYAVNKDIPVTAPYYTIDKTYYAVVALQNTDMGYTYSLSAKLEKSFDFGLDLSAAYTFTRATSVNDGTSSVAYSNWKYNYSVDPNSGYELSYSLFDKPHKITAVVSYNSPKYARILSTNVTISYQGGSGQRYSYTMDEGAADFNGDGQKGNSLLYVPTADQIGLMNWASPADAAKYEAFIREDPYLSNHRGMWTERYGGIAPFEHHFDLHFSENIFYDPKHNRKIELMLDVLNFSNIFNRAWGLNYSASYNRTILEVASLTKDEAGNMTPTYKFNPKGIYINDFYSRWRCQIGVRVTF